MSLFSRLDRLRARELQAESQGDDGLFAVPELTPTQNQSVPPVGGAEESAPTPASAKAASTSPLSSRNAAASTGEAPRFAPVSPDVQATAPDEHDDDKAAPAMFANAPFRLPRLRDLSESELEAPGASTTTVFAPTEMPPTEMPPTEMPPTEMPPTEMPPTEMPLGAPPKARMQATSAPAAETSPFDATVEPAPAEKPLSPFERLMAARAAQAPTETPRPTPAKTETPKAETGAPKAEAMEAEASEAEAPEAEAPEVEAPEVEAPEVEAPITESLEVESLEAEAPEVEAPEIEAGSEANEIEDEAAQAEFNARTPELVELNAPAEVSAAQTSELEAPETESETPAAETAPTRPARSLADRLAGAPRETAPKSTEAPAEVPMPKSVAAPSMRAVPIARSKAFDANAFDAKAFNAEAFNAEAFNAEAFNAEAFDAEAEVEMAPVALTKMTVPSPSAPDAIEIAPARPRSFSERLAARTGLDSHLTAPAEAPAASQQIAPSHTELARVDEGVELSEREMKNRILFRQKHLIFDAVVGSLDPRVLQNPTKESVKPLIARAVESAASEFNLDLDGFERNWMVDEFVRELTDLGPLVSLLEDPAVNKIVVTGANDVSVERLGRVERTGVSFRDDDHLLNLVRRMAEMSGGRVDAKVPLLDRPLPDGARIRAKVPPLAPQPTLTIEKSTGNPFVALKRQLAEKARDGALPYAQLRERIQQKLLRGFEGDAAALGGDQDKLRAQVEEMIGTVIAEERVAVSRAERASLVMDLLNEIVGLGPIEPLLNDPEVDEVMVNGPYQIYVERKGKLELSGQRFRDNAHVMQVIDRIVAPLGRRVDEKSPMVDGRLRDGSRFNAIIPPLALSGPTMTIRKFARDPFTMSDLINFGSMTREAAQFLQAAVEGRLNIVVSGGTGSGKTTTLNVLSSFIPSSERIVTIEDAAELQMRQEHVIRMEARPPNIEGVGEVGIRDLVRNSLRMRPDRIVVGECRGGEALDMLQAMNTGHDGSLTTAHSNGPRDTLKRLETMVMMAGFDLPIKAIREQIAMAVQLIVHQERMRDGKRRVTAITEIVGMEGDVVTMQDIFRFEQDRIDEDGRIHGALCATGMRPKHYETIIDNGAQVSMELFHPRSHEDGARALGRTRGAVGLSVGAEVEW